MTSDQASLDTPNHSSLFSFCPPFVWVSFTSRQMPYGLPVFYLILIASKVTTNYTSLNFMHDESFSLHLFVRTIALFTDALFTHSHQTASSIPNKPSLIASSFWRYLAFQTVRLKCLLEHQKYWNPFFKFKAKYV